jgi:hypothetical protein
MSRHVGQNGRERAGSVRGGGHEVSRQVRTGVLVLLFALVGPVTAARALPALHLTAFVYDVRSTPDGTVSSREELTEGRDRVGEDFSRCVPNSRRTVRCAGSYTLTQGTIRFAGTISNTGNKNRLMITGGTGRYKHARGSILTEYNRSGTGAKETITFR